MAAKTIYLASRSPRRRELLRQIGVSFELLMLREDPRRRADADEAPLSDEAPRDYALRIAKTKAEAGLYAMAKRAGVFKPVLSADTTIALDNAIIGKPADAEDAHHILQKLSGRSHTVITAVALALGENLETRVSESTVWMRSLEESEIRSYVASGEPLDKAGAYAVQGRAAAFITRIDGSYSGIMGLPLAETAELLREFDVEVF